VYLLLLLLRRRRGLLLLSLSVRAVAASDEEPVVEEESTGTGIAAASSSKVRPADENTTTRRIDVDDDVGRRRRSQQKGEQQEHGYGQQHVETKATADPACARDFSSRSCRSSPDDSATATAVIRRTCWRGTSSSCCTVGLPSLVVVEEGGDSDPEGRHRGWLRPTTAVNEMNAKSLDLSETRQSRASKRPHRTNRRAAKQKNFSSATTVLPFFCLVAGQRTDERRHVLILLYEVDKEHSIKSIGIIMTS